MCSSTFNKNVNSHCRSPRLCAHKLIKQAKIAQTIHLMNEADTIVAIAHTKIHRTDGRDKLEPMLAMQKIR